MKLMILLVFCALSLSLAQEKTIYLDRQKVETRIDQLKKEYQELQRLVDDPMLAVPNWRARMRQIEGSIGAFSQSLEDSSLFWVKKDSSESKNKK